ncbi:MAG: hypothetical protein L0271_16395 [Gemmatimonadetes bacterium]|nr:hypothetical protein [Gemmatimonadota bacterium]
MRRIPGAVRAFVAIAALCGSTVSDALAQAIDRYADRGTGQPTSMFAITIDRGEFILYPFFEYYLDDDAEYSPSELGHGLDQDFRGRYRASEGLIFLGYGVSDRLAVEFEAAVITAKLDKSPDDPTAVPDRIEESGLGDVEGQLRWRWNRETDTKPEWFTYFETVFPLQKDKVLIGTRHWEFKLGTGVVRGRSWGTTTFRLAVEYDGEENKLGLGEYAVEYLKRVSSRFRAFAAVEGSEDEVELITEAQAFLRQNIILKLNNAFGVTSKATDWAPEIGVLFVFR